jgi:hypothetical protein
MEHIATAFFSSVILGALGYILDIWIYYRRNQILELYTNWWFSLSETSLVKINQLIVHSLHLMDKRLFEPKIISLNALAGIAILTWIFSWIDLIFVRGQHSLAYYNRAAGGLSIILFPFLCLIITFTRLLIHLAAKWSSPKTTGLIALFLAFFIVIVNLAGSAIIGAALPYIPVVACKYNISPHDQLYIVYFFYNLSRGVGNTLVYVACIPFYYYLLVGMWVYFSYISIKFMERYFAREVDSSNFKVFTSSGVLLGVIINIVIIGIFPSVTWTLSAISDLKDQVGFKASLVSCSYIGQTILKDPKEKANFEAFVQELLNYAEVNHTPEQVWADGSKGNDILFKLYTGHDPPRLD